MSDDKAVVRDAITVDLSADYCTIAQWRTNDPQQLAKAAGKPFKKPKKPKVVEAEIIVIVPPQHDHLDEAAS